MFNDDYVGTLKWHSLAEDIAKAFNPDGGLEAVERAKMILCNHGIWPLSIAADVEAAG